LVLSSAPLAAATIQEGPADIWMRIGVPGGLIAASAIFLALLMVPRLLNTLSPAVPAPNLEEAVPLSRIDPDMETVVCDDGVVFKVIELDGVNFASLGQDELDNLTLQRRYLMRRLEEIGSIDLFVFSERARMNVEVAEGGGSEWLEAVNAEWAAGFKRSFVNRHAVLVIDRRGGNLGAACTIVREVLEPYGAKILRHSHEDVSPLWAFLYRMVMGIGGPGYHGPGLDLAAELSDGSIVFDPLSGLVQGCSGERRRYWKIIGLKSLGDSADIRMMRALSNVDREAIAVHRIMPLGRTGAALEIKRKRQNSFTFMDNLIQTKVFDDADDRLQAGEESYVRYELSITVFGDTAAEADDAAAEIKRLLARSRATGVTETRMVEEAHWDRFPRRRPVWLREWMPRISDVAEFLPFEGTPRGLQRCWWGPRPLRTMRTSSGVPYAVGVHEHGREEALGNAAFIGKPGAGKTTMAAWLLSGVISQFKDARVFAFDNLDGLTVPTKAFGGRVVSPGEHGGIGNASLAPLQVENTRENREFLAPFLLELCGLPEDPEHLATVNEGLGLLMPQDKASRTLTNFVNTCVQHSSPVYSGLRAWVDGGNYSGWFDGERDSLDLGEGRWVTFDMQRVIEHERLAAPVVSYVLHRIRTEVWRHPTPHVIFIDEAATLAESSPQFVRLARYLLRNIRKKMGVVWLAYQDPGGMGAMGEVVRNSTATMFLWRDPAATDADYEGLNLTDADMRFIRDRDEGLRHLRRAVLAIRKMETGRESVVIDADLSRLGEKLQLFRSGTDAAEAFVRNEREYGPKCVEHYLRDMRSPPD